MTPRAVSQRGTAGPPAFEAAAAKQDLVRLAVLRACAEEPRSYLRDALLGLARDVGAKRVALYAFKRSTASLTLRSWHPAEAAFPATVPTASAADPAGRAWATPHEVVVDDSRSPRELRLALSIGAPPNTSRSASGVLLFEGLEAGRAVELPALRRQADDFGLGWSLVERIQGLRETNGDLEAFNHRVAHDLMQPLRTITQFSGFILEDGGPSLDANCRAHAERVHRCGLRLQSMLADVLRLSRAGEAGGAAPVDMGDALAEATTLLDLTLKERRATVRASGLPRATADRTAVLEILLNLISNGIKFNESPEPRIEIGARPGPKVHTFFVRDNGVGIPPEHRERVFELFVRLPYAQRADVQGTGAGLAIVKRAVERQGGTVWVDSIPGAGSTFWFTLPAVANEVPVSDSAGPSSTP